MNSYFHILSRPHKFKALPALFVCQLGIPHVLNKTTTPSQIHMSHIYINGGHKTRSNRKLDRIILCQGFPLPGMVYMSMLVWDNRCFLIP